MTKATTQFKNALEGYVSLTQQWKSPSLVTIIIPVYNAPEDTRKCLTSVFSSAADFPFDVIIADDASSETRLADYFNIIEKKQCPNIRIIRNDKNIGYTKNCNLAMAQCTSDVILLNSDTIVPSGWVQKLYATAYSEESIASVTPWSNTGYTSLYEDEKWLTELCKKISVETIQNHISVGTTCSKTPRLVTAVGFCMYLKREALVEIGDFDSETFPRGYGEENDWCMRATEFGYIHVLAQNVFVYHKRGQSFGQERKRLQSRAAGILKTRYPYYPMALVRERINSNLMIPRNEATINLIKGLASEKASVTIFVDDELENSFEFGRSLADGLKNYYSVYIVSQQNNGESIKWQYLSEYGQELPAFYFRSTPFTFESNLLTPLQPEHISIYKNIFRLFDIELMHVLDAHSIVYAPTKAAKCLGIPVVLSVHDFSLIHPNGQLTDENGNHLDLDPESTINRKWFSKNTDLSSKVLNGWIKQSKRVLGQISTVIFTDSSTKEIILGKLPECKKIQTRVIPSQLFRVPKAYKRNQPSDYKKKSSEVQQMANPFKETENTYHEIYSTLIDDNKTINNDNNLNLQAHSWASYNLQFETTQIDNSNLRPGARYTRVENHPVTGTLIKLMRFIKRDPSF